MERPPKRRRKSPNPYRRGEEEREATLFPLAPSSPLPDGVGQRGEERRRVKTLSSLPPLAPAVAACTLHMQAGRLAGQGRKKGMEGEGGRKKQKKTRSDEKTPKKGGKKVPIRPPALPERGRVALLPLLTTPSWFSRKLEKVRAGGVGKCQGGSSLAYPIKTDRGKIRTAERRRRIVVAHGSGPVIRSPLEMLLKLESTLPRSSCSRHAVIERERERRRARDCRRALHPRWILMRFISDQSRNKGRQRAPLTAAKIIGRQFWETCARWRCEMRATPAPLATRMTSLHVAADWRQLPGHDVTPGSS